MINFNYQIPFRIFKGTSSLKQFLVLLCNKEHKTIDKISVIFCSDEYLLQLNQQFLQHDTYTDIITFDYTTKKGPLNGEIYISVDRVKDNARNLGTSFKNEIHRVVFHGVLHLCGYKDKLKEDKLLMRAKEDFYLREYFG
jgi:probable rRNA maturation factor